MGVLSSKLSELRVLETLMTPFRVVGEHRRLTQEGLAKKSKVSRAMIAAIEACHKRGGIGTLKKLAGALEVDLDNLA